MSIFRTLVWTPQSGWGGKQGRHTVGAGAQRVNLLETAGERDPLGAGMLQGYTTALPTTYSALQRCAGIFCACSLLKGKWASCNFLPREGSGTWKPLPRLSFLISGMVLAFPTPPRFHFIIPNCDCISHLKSARDGCLPFKLLSVVYIWMLQPKVTGLTYLETSLELCFHFLIRVINWKRRKGCFS